VGLGELGISSTFCRVKRRSACLSSADRPRRTPYVLSHWYREKFKLYCSQDWGYE